MLVKNKFWHFNKVLTNKFCEDIIKTGLAKEKQIAITGNNKGQITKETLKKTKKIRNSNVVWLNEPWIFKEVQPYIHAANKNAGWNFDWDWSESAQFTIYDKKQHYNWHRDAWGEPYDNKDNLNVHGKIRKLSAIVSLSNPEHYKGGELFFDFENVYGKPKPYKCQQIKPQGSIIIFPSDTWHKVSPVIKGNRYSLVIWCLGKPFK
jgi:PKHD-type hydroxylase